MRSRSQRRSKRWPWKSLVAFLVLLLGLLGAYRSLVHRPKFYRQAIADPLSQDPQTGRRFEQSIADIHNALRNEGDWQISVAESELNSWLEHHQDRKLPRALPDQFQHPRVVMQSDRIQIGCEAEWRGIPIVLSLDLELFLTDEKNVVGVKVRRLRGGAIPFPITQIADRISQSANKAGLKVRWTQDNGKPLALITFPDRWDERDNHSLEIKQIGIQPDLLFIQGTTELAR